MRVKKLMQAGYFRQRPIVRTDEKRWSLHMPSVGRRGKELIKKGEEEGCRWPVTSALDSSFGLGFPLKGV